MPLSEQVDVLKFFKEFLTIAKTVSLRKSLQIHQTSVVNDFMKFITRVLNATAKSPMIQIRLNYFMNPNYLPLVYLQISFYTIHPKFELI